MYACMYVCTYVCTAGSYQMDRFSAVYLLMVICSKNQQKKQNELSDNEAI